MGRKEAGRWIECYRPNPEASIRLFCFPYSGGGAQVFRTWHTLLPHSVEVCPIQPPGRWTRIHEPPFNRVSGLVQAMISGLSPYMNQRFAIFGHSLGALIAFELARELRRRGASVPCQLFVSSHRAPQIGRAHPPISSLPDNAFIDGMRELYDGIPAEVMAEPELLELLLPMLRADIEAYETYEYLPEPPLDCPISALGGREDQLVSRDALDAWHLQTTRGFSLRLFPGGHFYLNTSRDSLLQELASQLSGLCAFGDHA